MKTCANCANFQASENNQGRCKAKSPVAFLISVPGAPTVNEHNQLVRQAVPAIFAGWPSVTQDEWCAEFRPKVLQ